MLGANLRKAFRRVSALHRAYSVRLTPPSETPMTTYSDDQLPGAPRRHPIDGTPRGDSMRNIRGRSARQRALAGVVVTGLLLALPACGGSSNDSSTAKVSVGPNGTDDGAKLTLWTRALLEKQAKLLVAAYNSSHKNQVALTV